MWIRDLLRILDEAGYNYLYDERTILLPGKANEKLPDDAGILIEAFTGDKIRVLLLTNREVGAEEALRLLRLNMELGGYCFALDPEGYLVLIAEAPVLSVLEARRLDALIRSMLRAAGLGG